MATATVYSTTDDARIESQDADYETARAGGTFTVTDDSFLSAGQNHDSGADPGEEYEISLSYLSFNLNGSGITGTITAATLSLVISAAGGYGSGDVLEARLYAWTSPLTDADWVDGDDLGSQTLVASRSAATLVMDGSTYNALTESGTALRDAIGTALAGDGILRLLLCTSRTSTGDAPSDAEEVVLTFPADQPGTTIDPKLVVTYTAGAGSAPMGLRGGLHTLSGGLN